MYIVKNLKKQQQQQPHIIIINNNKCDETQAEARVKDFARATRHLFCFEGGNWLSLAELEADRICQTFVKFEHIRREPAPRTGRGPSPAPVPGFPSSLLSRPLFIALTFCLVFTFVFAVVHDKSEKDQQNQIRQPLLCTQVAQTCTDMFYAQFICICRTAKLDATVCLACVRRQLHQSMPTPQSVGDSYKLWLIDWCDAFASAKSTPPTRHLCTLIVQSLNLSCSRHKYALDTPRRKLLTRQVHKFI